MYSARHRPGSLCLPIMILLHETDTCSCKRGLRLSRARVKNYSAVILHAQKQGTRDALQPH